MQWASLFSAVRGGDAAVPKLLWDFLLWFTSMSYHLVLSSKSWHKWCGIPSFNIWLMKQEMMEVLVIFPNWVSCILLAGLQEGCSSSSASSIWSVSTACHHSTQSSAFLHTEWMLADYTSASIFLSQVVCGHSCGLLKWLGSWGDALMTRWWSCLESAGAPFLRSRMVSFE